VAITPQPERCGHCAEAELITNTPGGLHCLRCGKQSDLDGNPIEGNAHYRANHSTTLPEANRHGISDF